ncbi:fibronectin type III domain-containing protein [Streptomyces sp. 549]|uniref:fibronectin type III domain-containing protein n=1 Tax=Streptomyces sp. 549 TaxID=3049076 RepID=UPI0024C36F13|nr:fibronectin type III domain-containing protein [Streptomyces sp. 549]MDK1471940.1 fibronectin type III domain-containing protein [Streptomyces sp. 549]
MRRIPGPLALAAAVCLPLTGCGLLGDSDGRPPTPPAGLTVQASSSTSAHVMWNKSTDDVGVTGYEVYRDEEKVEEVPGDRYMVDVAGLEPSAEYTFTVRAKDAAGNLSRPSRKVPVTMLSADTDDEEPPTAPTGLTGRAEGARAATLTWKKSEDNLGVASYDIHQGDTRIHSVPGDETSTLVTGLRPGTDYVFTVRARDTADNASPASNAVELTTATGPGGGASTAPADFTATSSRTEGGWDLELTWTPPRTGGEVAEYEIHLDGEFATTLSWGDRAPDREAAHSFFISDREGTTHRVKLRARLPDGTWGRFSAERTVTTGARG